MTHRVDVLDLASEIDLQKMERLMSQHPGFTCDIVYSPYTLLIWEDEFKTVRIGYFERSSQRDMKLAEEIMNSKTIVNIDTDVKFPFAFFRWEE
jgi:uncharacterized protein (DUF302 family)